MSNCGCSSSSTPQPCCQDCSSNPCEQGCLDTIDAGCIQYTGGTPSCLAFANNAKLDAIIAAIDDEICALNQSGDKFVRVTSVDPVSGYLYDKLTVCDFLSKTITTVGGQQRLELCLNSSNIISADESNAIFMDTDGLNINYTLLVNAILADSALVTALCTALSGC